MKTTQTKAIVKAFINDIWNNRLFDSIDSFLADDFIDHSLPSSLLPNKLGTLAWIKGMDLSFEHHTEIVDQVCEGNSCMIKINLHLKHIGKWREIEATGSVLTVVGYRSFKLADTKIIAHWALIDGNAIENQLRQTAKGCKVQE